MSEYYFSVNDVMQITGVKEGMAYKLIREVNDELKSKGFITLRGKVPKAALFERLGIKEEVDD